ncbi:MAG TPA: type II toxin-antitoxin system VapC family toxin, partial [Bacillota bacterium]|nr:type II toxin-antitoxin system VapC family toxin [Bacillota bacterium]
ADPKVLKWFQSVKDDDLFLSVLVLGEVRKGVEQVRASDPAQARILERWLSVTEQAYAERILPVTPKIADEWGRLSAARPLATIDALLAATALIYDLTLVTRNVQHVAHTGAKWFNPFNSKAG